MSEWTEDDAGWRGRRIRQHGQVVFSGLGDAAVLVHLHSNRIFELNATGFRIWELAAGDGRSLGEIAAILEREFDGDAGRIHADLLALVDGFSREGLIVTDDTARDETA